MDLKKIFETYGGDYLDFEAVEVKLSARPDIHAFILLEKLAPGNGDMVSAAEHDEIWLDVDLEVLAFNATEADIRDLIRCGVRYDDDVDSLAMFV